MVVGLYLILEPLLVTRPEEVSTIHHISSCEDRDMYFGGRSLGDLTQALKNILL